MSHHSFDDKCLFLSDADDLGGSPWWVGRGDFSQPGLGGTPGVGSGEEELSDVSSGRAGGSGGRGRRRVAQFTEYSITSSVVPRSEGTATRASYMLTFESSLTYQFNLKSQSKMRHYSRLLRLDGYLSKVCARLEQV